MVISMRSKRREVGGGGGGRRRAAKGKEKKERQTDVQADRLTERKKGCKEEVDEEEK